MEDNEMPMEQTQNDMIDSTISRQIEMDSVLADALYDVQINKANDSVLNAYQLGVLNNSSSSSAPPPTNLFPPAVKIFGVSTT